MTEKFIQKALLWYWKSHQYKFANIFYFENESDWLSFLKSGFCYEAEVKVSRSDFFADFKKTRHEIQSKKNDGSKYFIRRYGTEIIRNPSWELTAEYPELVTAKEFRSYRGRWQNQQEYFSVNFEMEISTRIEFLKVENQNLPNKFFYAVPEGMVSADEVPEYAGLLYVTETGQVKKVRDGKFIHRDKLDIKRAFNKAYYVYESTLIEKLTMQ